MENVSSLNCSSATMVRAMSIGYNEQGRPRRWRAAVPRPAYLYMLEHVTFSRTKLKFLCHGTHCPPYLNLYNGPVKESPVDHTKSSFIDGAIGLLYGTVGILKLFLLYIS